MRTILLTEQESSKQTSHGPLDRFGLIANRISNFLLTSITYIMISIFFFIGLISSYGDVAQQDWGIPLTVEAALNNLHSLLFTWQYNGFGGAAQGRFAFPFFALLNAGLAPIGFIGGTEVKVLSVLLIALAGMTAYVLARSLKLGWFSSFLSGLFYMSTPVMFNWLMFGFIYYSIAYDLLPLFILSAKIFLQTGKLRYAMAGGIILSIAMEQPTFILIYPLIGLGFAIFESKGNSKIVLEGLAFTIVCLSVWFLTDLSYFVSFPTAGSFSFYEGVFLGVITAQYSHLSILLNPIRLWGSTYNYQFETYFPSGLILLSFLPLFVAALAVLLRPHDRRVLFFSVAYLSVYVASFTENNLHYLVLNLPYGSVFEAPSIFLVPAALGLALLVGYANEAISRISSRYSKSFSGALVRNAPRFLILTLIITAGVPWWTGQASGNPIPGPPTKLNLYQIPPSYVEWTSIVRPDSQHFVLYLPGVGNPQIANTSYFSEGYEGVNNGLYYDISNLPYVSVSNASLIVNELLNGSPQWAENWGSVGVKYIVVYTNVLSQYNMSKISSRLSAQVGIVKAANFPDVTVYEDQYAEPVVYSNSSNATVTILHHNPVFYRVLANSSSPYYIILNQAYSAGWAAYINGVLLPTATHVRTNNSFNGWYINRTGTVTINLYYEPQTAYLTAFISSLAAFFSILFYILIPTANTSWQRRQRHFPQKR